jgi:two-component system response regulator MprA
VLSVDNGAGLIDCLASEGPFDLIVTDISMPWMDSLKTLRSVRSAGVTTPVIVITALTDEQIPSRVQALGANAILLRKPFDLDELAAAARRMTTGGVVDAEPQREGARGR